MSNKAKKVVQILGKIGGGLAVLIFLVVVMLWLAGTFKKKIQPETVPQPPPPTDLNTYTVQRRSFSLIIEQVGTLRTRVETKISSRVLAQVREILIQEGEEVVGPEKNPENASILVHLDSRDLQAQLNQAQAQVEVWNRSIEASLAAVKSARAQVEAAQAKTDQALSDYQRYQQLFKDSAATQQQLEQAQVQKDVTQAQLRAAEQVLLVSELDVEKVRAQKIQAEAAVTEAQVMFSYTVIKAPCSGRIARKMIEVGDMVTPGQQLFVLENYAQPELHAVVSESLIEHLSVGTSHEVLVDALNRTFTGRVREIITQVDPDTRTALVKVSLPETPRPITGLFGRLLLDVGQYEALVIPTQTVRQVGQLHLVQVVDDQGYPHRRFITIGKTHDQEVEVLSGLQEGEAVIIP